LSTIDILVSLSFHGFHSGVSLFCSSVTLTMFIISIHYFVRLLLGIVRVMFDQGLRVARWPHGQYASACDRGS
jgi:hypothetical protein